MGRWLDEALAAGQGQVRHLDDGPSANRPLVIVKFIFVAFILALVLPFVFIGGLIVFYVGLSSIGHGGYLSFAFGFLSFAFLVAVTSAVVLAVRRARRTGVRH